MSSPEQKTSGSGGTSGAGTSNGERGTGRPQTEVGTETADVVERGEVAAEAGAHGVVEWEAAALAAGVAVAGLAVGGVVAVGTGLGAQRAMVDAALKGALVAVGVGAAIAVRRWSPRAGKWKGTAAGSWVGRRESGGRGGGRALEGVIGTWNAAGAADRIAEEEVGEAHTAVRRSMLGALERAEERANERLSGGDDDTSDRELREAVARMRDAVASDNGGGGMEERAARVLERELGIGERVGERLEMGTDAAVKAAKRGVQLAKQLARWLVRKVAYRVQEEVNEEEDLGWAGKRWISERDDRVRASHQYLDGQRVAIDGVFTTQNGTIRYPGDVSAPVGEWINCRCHLELLKT